jgi:hypothetical protein
LLNFIKLILFILYILITMINFLKKKVEIIYHVNNKSKTYVRSFTILEYKFIKARNIISYSPQGNFCENIKNNSNSNANTDSSKTQSQGNRYFYDFQSPEQQTINILPIYERISLFIIKIIIIGIVIYYAFLQKFNPISRKRNLYLVNEYFELKFARYISKRIHKIYEPYIYKNDTPEAELILKIYKNLLAKNKINVGGKQVNQENIFIVDSQSIGAFLCKNGDLFISNRIIDLSNGNEDEIALFISSQITNVLLGNFTPVCFNILFSIFSERFQSLNSDDPSNYFRKTLLHRKREELFKYNKYLFFYPETCVINYYDEVENLRYNLKLLNKANYNLEQSIEIMKKFDNKMKGYPIKYRSGVLDYESRYHDVLHKLIQIYLIKK